MATYSYKGTDYEFVNIGKHFLEELKCPICLELVSDPVQTSCGHLFCGKCVKEAESCPVDRQSFTTSLDHYNERRVRNFTVKCPSKGRGCQWQGELGDADKHKSTDCDYVVVVCTNDGCDLEMERRQLDNHRNNTCPQRSYNCPFCSQPDTYQEVVTTHFTTCQEMPLPCPSGCGKRKLLRKTMAKHLSDECPEELVACAYAIAGCQHTVKRKNLKRHLKDKDQHFDTLMSSHLTLTLLVKDMVATINSEDQRKVKTSLLPFSFHHWLQNMPTCYPRPPWVIKMEGFHEKKEKNEEWFSDPVYSHFGGYKMCLRVYSNGHNEGKSTHVSLCISLMRGDNDDNLKWPFKGTIKVSLLNQLEDGQHHTREVWTPDTDVPEDAKGRIVGRETARGVGQDHFIAHQDLGLKSDWNTQFLKDNILFFSVDCFEAKLD